jgi:hypothetical protein
MASAMEKNICEKVCGELVTVISVSQLLVYLCMWAKSEPDVAMLMWLFGRLNAAEKNVHNAPISKKPFLYLLLAWS